ncbi:Hypothetical predicted protein [Octopus vulgaris]|uniref:Uncharacterized protein n=1 Tax=Octopus vulgaris TaxID=6645 RepID=A0AA36BL10_OCTVU|nr:Hypothetical predicted protein [Octopus vulgaris]
MTSDVNTQRHVTRYYIDSVIPTTYNQEAPVKPKDITSKSLNISESICFSDFPNMPPINRRWFNDRPFFPRRLSIIGNNNLSSLAAAVTAAGDNGVVVVVVGGGGGGGGGERIML